MKSTQISLSINKYLQRMQNKVSGNDEAAVTHLELTAREASAAEHRQVLTRDAARVFLG